MTDKQKKILLQELCCRLPYGVICNVPFNKAEQKLQGIIGTDLNDIRLIFEKDDDLVCECYLSEVKPYLRPMESMTEDEKKFYAVLCRMDDEYTQPYNSCHLVDWLLEHHFDWRGLIKVDLALPAPDGMYKF